jgi:molybdenum ABC transporter molybdate-binding protein
MKKFVLLLIIFCVSAVTNAGELHVFSNGNIRPILVEIGHIYESRNPEWKVEFATGKVQELKDKLDAGAKADVVLGDDKFFEVLADLKLLDAPTQTLLFTNPVVAVATEESEDEIPDPRSMNADNFKKIALVSEKSPLGKLVRAYLEPMGLKDAPAEKKIEVTDSKAAMDAVKNGEAKWTLVYSSDASKRKIRKLFMVPDSSIPAVPYSAAILNRTENRAQAKQFMEILQSTIGSKFFENAGYLWRGVVSSGSQLQTRPQQTRPQTQTQTQTQTQLTAQTQTQSQTQPQAKSKTETKSSDKSKKKKKKPN